MSTESKTETVEAPKLTRYCPKCESRYTYNTAECRTCAGPLVESDPRSLSFLDLKIDVPLVILSGLFFYGYQSLPGEARSFGIIFFIIAYFLVLVGRTLRYFEWKSRR